MRELMENEAFCVGLSFGLHLYQQKVVDAHRKKEPLMINGDMYYLESGQERLERFVNEICK